ncbi:hypothetical protein SAMN05443634_1034 [Chishuiella changwenlii]|uniref:Uncharacterized protein n=2 Tax=Chishuiella changwenlii TaxID=1434701 RepID=A0A1M6UPF6_9FLAO|nr:hypothetical protein [Chishuiella changwenlii]GGF11441.1 hypothetical protein GCM10010984_30590 [Chishuiella changwenlii]SHK71092.1 hypothetical protein SAMN05443634_1034 [Chishuiella changwenlii]
MLGAIINKHTLNSMIPILDDGRNFTPLIFYTEFLPKLAEYYKNNKSEDIKFLLFQKGDTEIFSAIYRIDPISTPLLLSIIEQLSKFHKKSLELYLNNNHATIKVLGFLFRADFFKISRENKILYYNENYLGAFQGNEIRKEHIIKSYKKKDFPNIDFDFENEIQLRDHVNSIISYNVQTHFGELLYDNINTANNHNEYINILSELITNGVIHSQSTTYAMMFVDKYQTKFSISDNGIGFKNSLNSKQNLPFYYKKNEFESNTTLQFPTSINKYFIENLLEIFEILFYSSLKERKGLFDLMLNVVLHSNGYFRLHTNNCQIIISNRIFKYITSLNELRDEILESHKLFELEKISLNDYQQAIIDKKNLISKQFEKIINATIKYYSEETKFSSIRFYNVRFKGVHIEVEIPN